MEGAIEHIQKSLKWLGLNWDEGPYIQSKRLDVYKKYAEILIKKDYAYPDPYTVKEVEKFRQEAQANKKPFLYREHRPADFGVWDGTRPLRFKVPEIKSYKWNDLVQGDLSAGPEALDDFILIKSDGYPTYNFAHIVDDIEMKVTHVMRGEEFISSTPKFLSVYQALDIEPPYFATLPVILGENGTKKLSKRDGAKDLLEYREDGYLPDAFINFLALLGWNPGTDQEIFTRDELIRAFDIERVQKSGAQMSQEKLDWINKEHIKKLPKEEIEKNILERLPEKYQDLKIVPIILERISKWGDVKNMVDSGELDFFFTPPEIEKDKLPFRNISAKRTSTNLKLAVGALTNIEGADFTAENVKNALMLVAGHLPSRGELLHPVRFALSGKDKSPDPFTIAYILGKNETISRLQKAI